MSSATAILIVVVIVALAVAAWALIQRQKTRRLRGKYGPEYDRLAQQENSPRRAESILEEREKRVAKFQIRSLREDQRERFAAEWRTVQEKFVDDPRGAVSDADRLINEALKARGYPMIFRWSIRTLWKTIASRTKSRWPISGPALRRKICARRCSTIAAFLKMS
jgi:hypothetical protein